MRKRHEISGCYACPAHHKPLVRTALNLEPVLPRPDNPGLLILLIVIGALLMTAILVACHKWSTRLISTGRNFVLRYFVPLLVLPLAMVAAFLLLPAALAILYSSFYGYVLQTGETAGPGPDAVVFLPILLWPYGAVLLILYYLIACFRRGYLWP